MLSTVREAGTRLSVDDAGAGFSGLSHTLKLAPDFIELEAVRSLGVRLVQGFCLGRPGPLGAALNFAGAARRAQVTSLR